MCTLFIHTTFCHLTTLRTFAYFAHTRQTHTFELRSKCHNSRTVFRNSSDLTHSTNLAAERIDLYFLNRISILLESEQERLPGRGKRGG